MSMRDELLDIIVVLKDSIEDAAKSDNGVQAASKRLRVVLSKTSKRLKEVWKQSILQKKILEERKNRAKRFKKDVKDHVKKTPESE